MALDVAVRSKSHARLLLESTRAREPPGPLRRSVAVKRTVVLAVMLLVVVGCSNKPAPAPENEGAQPAASRAMIEGGIAQAPGAPAPPPPVQGVSSSAAPGPVAVPTERKVIRNGSLTVVVRALDEALSAIRSATEKAGGYVTNESQDRDTWGVRHGSITCRVPAAALDRTLAQFQSLGKVERVSVTAEDITEQYFNLEIRLRNQQDLEKRFRALLDRPGNKVSDLLEIEGQMARVRGEIDELEGRKRFWDSQVSLSTLTVQLHEPNPAIGSAGGGILSTLKNAIRQLGENFVETVAWLISALGVVIPAGLALWIASLALRAFRRRRGRPR
jgi:hypothetical protein